eukprot:CAMPEP_0185597706 /NCGR_PEP_ID=MMETSP0434-20130131/81542_1 /TAXON_ID=626734 ORGANISM="Favella taraikaensis, Strain Fe Narragansett Bay" /NCGR_SAMPLE_ID=MMETSP0434 /ASSEMBLY_ACC=CAM_ASM_000379 /LENGTH=42 /DNA_ID= /DNA_START= /DNA_END= /DNA_ORIENTATION=
MKDGPSSVLLKLWLVSSRLFMDMESMRRVLRALGRASPRMKA